MASYSVGAAADEVTLTGASGKLAIKAGGVAAASLAASVRSFLAPVSLDFNATTNPGAAVDVFVPLIGGWEGAVANYATVEANAKTPVNRAGIVQDIRFKIATQPVAGETVTVALRLNGADIGAALTFTNADVAGTVKSAQPAQALAVNDVLNWRLRTSSAVGAVKGAGAALIEVD